jgi:hypothetical protein
MTKFKIGDKVCFNADFFEETKSELIEKFGIGIITSEEYDSPYLPSKRISILRPLSLGAPHPHYINIKWNSHEEEYWEYTDYLCLIEEPKKRDIWHELEEALSCFTSDDDE